MQANINDSFESIFIKIIDSSARKDLIELDFNGGDEIFVSSIYLDDHDESVDYNFCWKVGYTFRIQSKETQGTINEILG